MKAMYIHVPPCFFCMKYNLFHCLRYMYLLVFAVMNSEEPAQWPSFCVQYLTLLCLHTITVLPFTIVYFGSEVHACTLYFKCTTQYYTTWYIYILSLYFHSLQYTLGVKYTVLRIYYSILHLSTVLLHYKYREFTHY